MFVFGVEKNHSFQVGQYFFDWFIEQAGHVAEVNAALFIQRDEQCFLGRAGGFNGVLVMDGPFAEDGGLGRNL
ncbi:MAG: hypothetical protein ACRED1_10075, partial [Limisphaerales bacterium]